MTKRINWRREYEAERAAHKDTLLLVELIDRQRDTLAAEQSTLRREHDQMQGDLRAALIEIARLNSIVESHEHQHIEHVQRLTQANNALVDCGREVRTWRDEAGRATRMFYIQREQSVCGGELSSAVQAFWKAKHFATIERDVEAGLARAETDPVFAAFYSQYAGNGGIVDLAFALRRYPNEEARFRQLANEYQATIKEPSNASHSE